jgi:hypothetical protein
MLAGFQDAKARRNAPMARLATPRQPMAALWPSFSIVFLLCAAVVLAPLLLTILNSVLVVLAVIIVLLTNRKIDPPVIAIVLPFSIICFLGLATGVGAPGFDYLKDLWYVINPVVVLLAGYILYRATPDIARGLRAFVIGGLIVGVWQMRGYFIEPSLILLPSATIRSVIGTGFYAPVLALGILIIYAGDWREGLKLPNWLAGTIAVVLTLAIAGVFSRAAVLVIAILFAARFGCFDRREWLRVGFPLAVFFFLVYLLESFVDTQSDQALLNFGAKLVRSVTEISVNDYSAARDVAINFRGYETQQALNQFAQSDVSGMLFGQGFGTLVDMGFHLPLGVREAGDRYLRFIPVLHNGYMYLLTKVGLVGLLLFVFVLTYVYVAGKRWSAGPASDPNRYVGRLVQAVALTLAATTYIIAGVFNKFDMFPFLLVLGYLLAKLQESSEALVPSTADPLAVTNPLIAGIAQVER